MGFLVRSLRAVLFAGIAIYLAPIDLAEAADHLDGPAASSDPAADITDIYAWMQDSRRINLIMNVFPLASEESRFSDNIQYVFHIRSLQAYGDVREVTRLLCTFSPDQRVTCSIGDDVLVSNTHAGDPLGVTSSDGSFRIFTGLRNDPFFFALDNFNAVRRVVRDAVPFLDFDEAGCPSLDQDTKDALVGTLVGLGGLPDAISPPRDFFEPLNVLSIVIQADRSLFGNGPLYSVSASTHRRAD